MAIDKQGQNPLYDYSDPSIVPDMTTDALVIDKRYAFTGVVNVLTTPENTASRTKTKVTYASPQTGQLTQPPSTALPSTQKQSKSWSSAKDKLGSKTVTGIQVTLKVPSVSETASSSQTQQTTFLNYISFELKDVPANWSIYFRDPISNTMMQLTDLYGNPVGGRTTGENPESYVLIQVFSQTISTSLLELRLDRNLTINLPPNLTDANKLFQKPYSFTLRNLDFRLLAENNYEQVPDNAVIASINALGLTEQYVKIQRDASQIQPVSNRTNSLQQYYWRSEPQAVGDAVVNLYVDMGSKQTYDSIYLDPLYSGVKFNLYSSNDPKVSGDFWCSRKQNAFTQKDTSNVVSFQSSGEQLWGPFGNTRTGAIVTGSKTPNTGLIVPGDLQLDGTQSWAMGLCFTPANNVLQSGATLIPNQELISNHGNYRLILTPDGVLGVYPFGSSSAIWSTAGTSNSKLIMQANGNLCLYNANGALIWQQGNGTAGSYLRITDSGDLRLYAPDQTTIIWSSGVTGSASANNYGGTLINQVLPSTSTNTVKLSYTTDGDNITFNAVVNGTSLSKTITKVSTPTSGWKKAPYALMIGYDNSDPSNPYAFLYVRATGLATYEETSNVSITNTTPFVYDGTSGSSYGIGIGSPGVITLGNDVAGNNPANAVLQDFWIRQDEINGSVFKAYHSHSRSFIDSYGPKKSASGVVNTLRGDYRALLLARLNNANVYAGPSSDYYDSKSWDLIKNDLTLRKATYNIPPISSRYVKFEFTNLHPTPYNLDTPINRYTKLFPNEIINATTRKNGNLKQDNYLGLSTVGVPSVIQPTNEPIAIPTSTGQLTTQVFNPPTQGELNAVETGSSTLTAPNNPSLIVDKTSSYVNAVNAQSVELPISIPYFANSGVHNYETAIVQQSWKQSYFVGVKALQVYKKSQTTTDDTEYYIDNGTTSPGSITSTSNKSIWNSESSTMKSNFSDPVGIYSVQASTPSSGYVTYTTWKNHGYLANQYVTVSGITTPSSNTTNYNGTFQIVSVTSNAFVVASTTTGTALVDNGLATVLNGYQATAAAQYLETLPLSSFSGVTSFQLAAVASDWVPLAPEDQALMTNVNPGYLDQINIQPLEQISQTTFQLRSGVWQVTPASGTVPSIDNIESPSSLTASFDKYGISTKELTFPFDATAQAGMRVSAAARVYLPFTANGTYTINLYATFNTGVKKLVASDSRILNAYTWNDLEVVWSVVLSGKLVTKLQAEIVQTNPNVQETMYVSMLSPFYNPISWSWTTDRVTYHQITSVVNDENGYVTINNPGATSLKKNVNTFYVRAFAHQPGAYIHSVLISPNYAFDPYTPTASINYMPDPRTNENQNRSPSVDQPMFFLPKNFYPYAYSLGQLSLSNNPL